MPRRDRSIAITREDGTRATRAQARSTVANRNVPRRPTNPDREIRLVSDNGRFLSRRNAGRRAARVGRRAGLRVSGGQG